MARGDKTVMFTARITEEQNEFLIELGDGSRSAGFTELLDRAMLTQNPGKAPARVQAPTRPAARPVSLPPSPPKRFIGKRR